MKMVMAALCPKYGAQGIFERGYPPVNGGSKGLLTPPHQRNLWIQ